MNGKPIRSLITVIMNVLVIVAVIVAAGIVVSFFGALTAKQWGQTIVTFSHLLTIPFGIEALKTPYGGIFDMDAALTVVVLLCSEWVLSILRARV